MFDFLKGKIFENIFDFLITKIFLLQPGPDIPLPSNPDVTYECMWESCDYMFEDLFDLHEHLITEANCHVSKVTQSKS